MRRFAFGLVVLALAAGASAESKWARYRVLVRDALEAQILSDSSLELFSEEVVIGPTDVIVGPNDSHELMRLGIPFTFISELPNPKGWDQFTPEGIDYRNQYFRYNSILTQFEEWRLAAPMQITREQIATSWGNRPVYAYKVVPNDPRPITKSVVIICGIHAREWVSPAAGLHVFERLKTALVRPAFNNGPQASSLGLPPGIAYYVVPVLNPDGYEYTWTNDRMWRKNRRNNGNGTFGVDLNRNFAKGWGGTGSSGNTNSSTYRGPSAFSEPETNGFRLWLQTIPPVAAFMDFHSYGEYVLWPWGYTETLPPGDTWLRATGYSMRDAIFNVYGRSFTSGPTSTTLYMVAGGSKDYIYDVYNAASFSIELRDTGQFGFLLPEDQIEEAQNEAWAGMLQLARRALLR